MADTLYLLDRQNHFVSGCFENITLGGHGIVLEHEDGAYNQHGCFISDEINTCAFTELIASWNCDTPENTSVELAVSVKTQNGWSDYLSYGLFSPFIERSGKRSQTKSTDCAFIQGDTVKIDGTASAFRFKMNLYSEDGLNTPCLRLLAAAIKPVSFEAHDGCAITRTVRVPAYSQLIRDPSSACETSAPVTVTMLINRFGEDILPDEFSHVCYDSLTHGYSNGSFVMAAAGCWDYKAYVQYTDIEGLKKEIKNGFACGACIRCIEDEEPDTVKAHFGALAGHPPIHTLAVCGFETDSDGTQYVIVNNPYAYTDEGARRRCTLEEFKHAWTGVAYILHEKQNIPTLCPPRRERAELKASEIPLEFSLYIKGERRSISKSFCDTGTICYTLREERAFATTAHRRFYYAGISESGNIIIDMNIPTGTKLTLFAITAAGTMYIAEHKI